MHSPGAVGLRGVAAVLRRQCARSRLVAPDGDAGDRTAGGHRAGGGGHGERSGCTVLGLEGKLGPCRSTDGVRLGGEGHALALFDVNDVPASVEVVFPAVCVRQDDAVEHGDIVQQHAGAADLGAGLVGVALLVAGEDVIGAALVQAVHRGGGDRRAAGGPPVAGGGGAGGVDVLLIGLEVADLKRRVGPVGVLLCRNVRQRRGVVVGGLADLRRCADDLAEIAILRDDDADADVLAHVSRTGDILVIGRVGNILPCAAAVRAALPLELALPDVDARGDGAGEEDGLTENGAVYVARLAREGLDLRRFADHQLDDMLVADDADGAAVLIQIQLQIKGIDLGVCALRNGDRMRGFIGIDGLCLLYCGRTGNIMLAPCSIAVTCVLQLLRQRLPLEGEGVRLAVVHILNGALPVLEVVDGLAVQRDGLHVPCVGDDSDGIGRSPLEKHLIITAVSFPFCPIHAFADIINGISTARLNNRAVFKHCRKHRPHTFIFQCVYKSVQRIESPRAFLITKVHRAAKRTAKQFKRRITLRSITDEVHSPIVYLQSTFKAAIAYLQNGRMGLERLLPAPEQHIFLKGTAVDVEARLLASKFTEREEANCAFKYAAIDGDLHFLDIHKTCHGKHSIAARRSRAGVPYAAANPAAIDHNMAAGASDRDYIIFI